MTALTIKIFGMGEGSGSEDIISLFTFIFTGVTLGAAR